MIVKVIKIGINNTVERIRDYKKKNKMIFYYENENYIFIYIKKTDKYLHRLIRLEQINTM